MKRMLAGGLTVVIVSAMICMGIARQVPPTVAEGPTAARLASSGGSSRLPDARFPGASDRIEGLIESAGKGDVAAYLAAFEDSLRARLQEEALELGWPAFSERLRRAAQAKKSHAIFAAEPDGPGPDAVRITVETAYRDRVERQTFRLAFSGGAWLVTEMTIAHDLVPKKPLGTLATFEAPEGVPVDAEPGE